MPRHPTRKCSRCYHPLPYGRPSWRPFWSLWKSVYGPTLTYAADGPTLGHVVRQNPPRRLWMGFVLSAIPRSGHAWPLPRELRERFRDKRAAMRAVEVEVYKLKLWSPSRCP